MPVERLDRSHRRLEERLEELSASALAIGREIKLDEHWEAVEDVLDYLQRATLRHEEDEEDTVFPRLRTHAALRPLLDRLSGDHRSQRRLVARLAKLVEGPRASRSASRVQELSAQLSESYLDHIDREDRQLLPAIHRHIDALEQAVMATEMAARRGR